MIENCVMVYLSSLNIFADGYMSFMYVGVPDKLFCVPQRNP